MPDPLPRTGDNLVTPDSLRITTVAQSVTNLRRALELWRDNGDGSLMLTRFMVELPRAHIAPEFVMLLYNWLDVNKLPYYILTHRSSESAQEKRDILSERQKEIFEALQTPTFPQPLKTVTLGYTNGGTRQHILISGMGDFRIEKELKRQVGQQMGVSHSTMKAAVINPDDFSTTIRLGLIPGIVGPVIEGHLVRSINGILYLLPQNEEAFLGLAVSPVDSMILRAGDFTKNLKAYAKAAYEGYEIVEKPTYIFFKNNRQI